jgi:hypothetical protein
MFGVLISSEHWKVLRVVVEGMGLRRSLFVFLPDLDCFVALGCDHAERRLVEFDVEDGCLGSEGTWLQRRFDLLEVVAGCPVVEVERAVVSA